MYLTQQEEEKFMYVRVNVPHVCLPDLGRASEWSRTGNCVAGRDRPVQLKLNPRVSRFVCTWKADSRRTGTATSCHIDLSTLHIELSTGVV